MGKGQDTAAVKAAAKAKDKKGKVEVVTIDAPNFEIATFTIVGESDLLTNAFSGRVLDGEIERQAKGAAAKKKNTAPKDFALEFEESIHRERKAGWPGIPCSALRNSMIRACSITGYPMARAKLSVVVIDQGRDQTRQPIVQVEGEPIMSQMAVRRQGKMHIATRGLFEAGWRSTFDVRYDRGQFTVTDVANLLLRAGLQVGILSGRPGGADGCGIGCGLFRLEGTGEVRKA